MAIPIKATLKVSSKAFTTGIKVAGRAVGGLVAIAKAATFALVGLTAAFGALVARQSAVIDRIGKVAKTTGIAAETLQRFSFAAELAGVSTDQAQVALRRFSRRLGEAQKGTGELAPTLKRLGIDLKDSSGEFKSAEDVLFDLADAIANTEGSSERLAIAFKAFDSEGAELVSVLANGSDAMRALFDEADSLGAVLSGSAIRGVEAFNDEFNKLQTLIGGIANVFVASLAPALTKVTKDFTNFLLKVAEQQGGIENLGEFLKDEFLEILKSVTTIFGTLINTVIELGRSIPRLDLFPVDPAVADRYNEISDALNLIGDKAKQAERSLLGIDVTFLGLAKGLDVADDLIKALETIGFDVSALKSMYDDLGMLDRFSAGSGFETDAVLQFNEALKNALLLATQVGDQTGIIAANQAINVQAIIEYIDSLKEAKPLVLEIKKGVEDTRTGFERLVDFLKEGVENMKAFQDATIDFATIFENVATRLGTPMERLQKTIEDGLVKGVELFEDTLTDAILKGKADFSALGDHIKQVLAKALVQRFITGPILAAFGLTGKAKGGPVSGGTPYIVGEKGPELFIPGASGTVIPNNQLQGSGGMGATSVVYNIQAVDAPSFQSLVARDPEFIYNVSRAGARRTPGG